MRLQDTLIWMWQRVPLSWRAGLVNSRIAPAVRRLANVSYSSGPAIFPLAEPLKGYRMRLEWQSFKAFVFGTYEREVTRTLLEIVQPGWVVFDVGAHIGYLALLLAKLVGPGGKVIAFEPSPGNFRTLEENIRMNDCRNVVLEKRAAAATTGVMNLRSNDTGALSSTASLVHGQPMMDVETVSLDDYGFQLQEQIRLVMMDVEGAETAVLQGMRSIVRRDRPTILIELHGFDSWGESHPALQELQSMDYQFRFLEKEGCQVHVLAEPRKSHADDGRTIY